MSKLRSSFSVVEQKTPTLERKPLPNIVSEHEAKRIMMIALYKRDKQVRASQQPAKVLRYGTK